MSPLAAFQSLLAAADSASSDPAVGWIGLDVPLEIIEASGRRPLRIRADTSEQEPAKSTFGEGGGHPGMRALVSRLMSCQAPMVQLAIGSTPVTGVWLYNLLISLGDVRPGADRWAIQLVDINRRIGPEALKHNAEAMRGISTGLNPPVAAGALPSAITARNAVRRSLRAIEGLRHGAAARLTGAQARQLIDAAEVASAETLNPLLIEFLARAHELPPAAGTPVVYSGTGGPDLALYQALEAQGLRIVADDQDYGTRAVGPDVAETGDPFDALAERYRTRCPAPAGWTTASRTAYLLDLAKERGAQAVIFEIAPFDHPAAWDQPKQTAALTQAGFKIVVLPADAGRDPMAAAQFVAGALAPETTHA